MVSRKEVQKVIDEMIARRDRYSTQMKLEVMPEATKLICQNLNIELQRLIDRLAGL